MSPRIIAGLALATAGVVLIIRSHHNGFTFSLSGMGGDLLTLCATLAWALYSLAAKPLLNKYSATKVTAYAMAAGSILLLPLSLSGLLGQSWSLISPASWFAAAFAAFIAGGAAYVLWYQGIKQIGVTRTMVYHYLMPFTAVLFSAAFLHERITMPLIVGGAAILSGVYLAQKQ
jgi:drug/metabolite transporter (DMT)-like permease